MADPFSIVIGTVSTVDVCVRLGKRLNEVRKGVGSIVQDLDHLCERVSSIKTVAEIIKSTFEHEWDSGSDSSNTAEEVKVQSLWRYAGEYIKRCLSIVSELEQLIRDILDPSNQLQDDAQKTLSMSTKERLRLYTRRRKKDEQFKEIEDRLDVAWKSGDLLLSAINV